MIYGNNRKRMNLPGGYFHLEEERSKTRVAGYGHGDHIKLKDEYGNVWLGSAVRSDDNSIVYRFRDGNGRTLTGVSDNVVVTLRDEKGKTWTAEMAIPMKYLAAKFDPKVSWRANFFRIEGEKELRFYSAWSPTYSPKPNFHVPSAFGTLVFQE